MLDEWINIIKCMVYDSDKVLIDLVFCINPQHKTFMNIYLCEKKKDIVQ